MDKPVENIDVWNILVTNDKMTDQMAYNIVKTLMEKKPDLVAVHKEAENIDLKNQKIGSPIPYHPGAKKYFEEQRRQVLMQLTPRAASGARRSAAPYIGRSSLDRSSAGDGRARRRRNR